MTSQYWTEKEEDSNWLKALVNYNQSPAERRAKYQVCRLLGDTRVQADRRRDWRWNKIARAHRFTDYEQLRLWCGAELGARRDKKLARRLL